MRGEKRYRRIAPVVYLSERSVLHVKLEDRQQLDGGNAELLEIRNLFDQAGISAALIRRDSGAGMPREASHVHLVNNGAGRRVAERRVALPIVAGGIDQHTLHRRGSVIARERRGIAGIVCRNRYA